MDMGCRILGLGLVGFLDNCVGVGLGMGRVGEGNRGWMDKINPRADATTARPSPPRFTVYIYGQRAPRSSSLATQKHATLDWVDAWIWIRIWICKKYSSNMLQHTRLGLGRGGRHTSLSSTTFCVCAISRILCMALRSPPSSTSLHAHHSILAAPVYLHLYVYCIYLSCLLLFLFRF